MLNKKIFISALLGFYLTAPLAKAYAPSQEYARMIYIYAAKSNTSGLKRISKRFGIDVMDPNGDTALCHAIKSNDVKTYKYLTKLGAKSKEYCLNKANFLARRRFEQTLFAYENSTAGAYNETGSLISRTKMPDPEGMGPATKLGLQLGAVALVGGGVAAIAGGGGGGGGSGGSSSGGGGGGGSGGDEPDIGDLPYNNVPVEERNPAEETNIPCEERGGVVINGECIVYTQPGGAPKDTDPNKYHTNEFKKSSNFLVQIGADYAYARGYTGYITNRDEDGYLIDENNTLTNEKIKVGILDNGFDINHPDLVTNMVKDKNGKAYGYTFDYGPCRGDDKTNCYAYIEENSKGYIVFYNSKSQITSKSTFTRNNYESIFKYFPDDYDWDKLKNDPKSYVSATKEITETLNSNENDHGTHVMGIVGATTNNGGMQGVAPNVELVGITYNVAYSHENVYDKIAEAFINENAKVVNMSFGFTTSNNANTQASYLINKNMSETMTGALYGLFTEFAKENIVTVKAVGNSGNNFEADILSGVPLSNDFKAGSEYDLSNLFITVVSVNSKNELAYYSQKCGATQNYCIAAPGGDYSENNLIYSTVQNDDNHIKNDDGAAYGYMQGTSMAAPVVTGSVALLMGAYPHLTSQQIVEIIFETATDLGSTGVDEIYGHGLLNLEAATSPIGYLNFDFVNLSAQNNYSQASLRLSKSVTSKILAALPETFTVFDKYDRAFEISTSSLVADTSKQRKHLFENDFKAFMSSGKQTIKANNNLSFGFNSSVSGNDIYSPYGFLSIDYKYNPQTSFHAFYSENTVLNNGKIFTRTEQNPFISMDNAFGTGFNQNFGKLNLAFDFVSGKNNFFEDEDNSDLYDNRMDVVNTELSYNLTKEFNLTSTMGLLREDSSVLGMIGSNAFDMNTSNTYFGGIKVSYKPTDKLSLSGSYYKGYTNTAIRSDMFNMSDIESESVALNATYHLTEKTNFGLDVYSPLRITKGTASISLASGRHPTEDTIYKNNYQTSLKDDTREWDFSMFYNTKIKDEATFKTRFGIRLNPEHDATAKPDYFGMFNLNFAL